MTSVAPPTEFFPGIDFNPSFYNLGQSAVTLDYLQSNYLRSTGYAISRAQFTLFNGTVDINENLDVSGNINASAYLLNGVPFTPSQWTTSVNDIYYTTGNVGIGKTNPSATYKLDVSGNINADKFFRAGTELTQYTDANVRTVLSTSAGTNMTWNTGTNKFDVAAPYTDTNVRTVLSTSVGTGLQWNSGTNRMNVVFPPSPLPYGDTEVRTLLSNSAGTNMTWNTGTNKFDVAAPYALPIASNGTLGGVKPDVDTIIVNPSTGIISLSGNDISLNGTTDRSYGWASSTSLLGRVAVAGSYSTGSIINDVVLRSAGRLILQTGITNPALVINATNQALFRNAVGINKTSIASGFILDVNGNVVIGDSICIGTTTTLTGYGLNVNANINTSGNINLANTSTGLLWGGTNSSLARAGVVGQYSTSSAVNDIILRSGNRLLLQSGTGAVAMVIDTSNNVFIGTSTNSSDDGNVNIAIPDSTFYVRGPRTAGTTTNISFRGGLEGNANGKVRIWMSSDAAHSSYIESHHTGNGFTNLSFGTSGGNVLPTERLRIDNNGNVGIGVSPSYKCHIKSSYDNVATGLHLDADDGSNNPNKYALTIWPYVLGGGSVGWRFRTQSLTGGENTPLAFTHEGTIRFQSDKWHGCSNGNQRVYYSPNNTTFLRGHGGTPFIFRSGTDTDIMSISSGGNLSVGTVNGVSITGDIWKKSNMVLYLYRDLHYINIATVFYINANLLLSEYSRPQVQWRWMLGISSGDSASFVWGFFCVMYDQRTGSFSSTRLAGNTQITISNSWDPYGWNRCVIDVSISNPPQYINVNIY
jgi:hypothetical protein